ncbi:MAG: glycosyltransferase family 10 [bacterium]
MLDYIKRLFEIKNNVSGALKAKISCSHEKSSPLHRLPGAESCPLRLFSFWDGADAELRLIQVLSAVLHKRARGFREVHVWSVFGPPPSARKSQDCLRVQFSGEAHYHDPLLFDVNLIPSIPGRGVVPLTLFALEMMKHTSLPDFCAERSISQVDYARKKFCLFVVSNDKARERIEFFEQLSRYKAVDSWGDVMNNQRGGRPPGKWWEKEYLDFIGQYRFMICFENTAKDFYLTEKLMNAYAGGAIPVYWGCPQAKDLLNDSAFLEINGPYSKRKADEVIKKIMEYESSYSAYRAVYENSLFKRGSIPPLFDRHGLADLVDQCR